MKTVLLKLLSRASDLADVQPVIALFLGAALLAVFLTVQFRTQPEPGTDAKPSLLWTLYHQFQRLFWALTLVAFLVAGLSLLRT